ncbi:hypothetical protein BG015_009072 [Linnemannia schmuckeri]|uniref:Uncharacterized protein n=1 Tax=Linnemannia schmuckeri TaxID=64567 RepID=A0A9P5V9L4_9FUNG|nr:hypothetical protein BG015_009072 [Linnemannia schmuckeri]
MHESNGNIVAAVRKRIPGATKESDQRLLMMGLTGSDKSYFFYRFFHRDTVDATPTIGFNVENFTFQQTKFVLWGRGGRLREFRQHHTQDAVGVVYVIDTSDESIIEEGKIRL